MILPALKAKYPTAHPMMRMTATMYNKLLTDFVLIYLK
jgi:hypothetical protein